MIKWILGSGSPRRKELLAGIGIEFEIRTKDTPEDYNKSMPVEDVPLHLAARKAHALLSELELNEQVICADTVVILDNEIIGKPESREEAINMLTRLSGKTHRVITGVFIGKESKNELFSETAFVTFKAMSQEEIEYYVDNFNPYDKAGSYGIQEWWGYVAIAKMEGTYTNVMGLPTAQLHERIRNWK